MSGGFLGFLGVQARFSEGVPDGDHPGWVGRTAMRRAAKMGGVTEFLQWGCAQKYTYTI